jgi:phage terminase large subunit-like protein
VFRFLGGDSKTLDGLNPSLALVDEYHAHKDDSVRSLRIGDGCMKSFGLYYYHRIQLNPLASLLKIV